MAFDGRSGNDVINWPNPNNKGWTPLTQASNKGHIESVRILLSVPNIYVNKAGKDGNIPLIQATNSGHIEIVRLLLDIPNIDVNKAGNDGKTPLWYASYYGNTEVAALLRAKGAK